MRKVPLQLHPRHAWLLSRRLIYLSLLSLSFVMATPAKAWAQYHFDSWTTDNGLPQNSVNAITQTRDGYLWFTTGDGLVRFDGVRFTVFDRSNSKGLTSNRFTCLYEDKDGALWVGTEDGGLVCYRDGGFASFTTADGLPHNWIANIQPSPGGELLVSTMLGAVLYRDGQVRPSFDIRQGRWENLRVYFGPSGARWTWDGNGLLREKKGQRTTYPIPLLTNYVVNTLYEDSEGALWLAPVPGGGVSRIKDGIVTHYSAKNGFKANYVNAIWRDRQGRVWFATVSDGLIQFKDGQFTAYTTADGLSSNAIKTIFEDREGTLWVGTEDRGLNKLTAQFIKTYTTADGLPNNVVYPIYEDRFGHIWVGTNGGLSRFTRGRFTNYFTDRPGQALALNGVQALAEDEQGRLWFGDHHKAGWLEQGKVTISPYFAGRDREPFQVIYQDRPGSLWFGAVDGLCRLKDGRWTSYTVSDGLPGNDVKAIHEDRQGTLWVGTFSGLARFKDGRFTALTTKDGLASDRIRCFYEDSAGTLWIGTYDGGLSRYRDGRFTNYTVNEGLFNNGVFQILEDSRGNFWISCNRGIYRVNKQQLNDFAAGKLTKITSVAYGKLEGMRNTECNGGRQPAGMKAHDGKFWLPTMGGVVVFDPETVRFNDQPPPVLIAGVSVDGADTAFRDGLQIGPGQERLEIDYVALSFVKPDQVSFKYKLAGQDRDWVDAGTARTAHYTHLSPGRYTFTIIAANSDGVWNTTGASLQLIVLPPFYRTWWFLLVTMTGALTLAVTAYRVRVAQLKRAHAAQQAFAAQLIESQERERHRIAHDLHDGLGQSLAIIRNRAMLSLNSPQDHHAVLDQMDEIFEAATEAMAEMRAVVHSLRPYQLDRFGLTRALNALIEASAASSPIRFSADIDRLDGVFSKEAEINLYRVVQESVNNIVRHSAATEANITVKRDARGVQIVIEDNGRGFVTDGGATEEGRPGMGLAGISERARMLGGKHEVQSVPGRGTKVTLKIGLWANEYEPG